MAIFKQARLYDVLTIEDTMYWLTVLFTCAGRSYTAWRTIVLMDFSIAWFTKGY